VQEIFSRLLRDPRPTATQIARYVSDILRRNEESRIYAWHQNTGRYPPPRPLTESG
jgi:hypothetical protein